MIIDTLQQFRRYAALNSRFGAVADFLAHTDLQGLSVGRHDILPEGAAFVNVQAIDYREPADIPFEFHRKYVDVQIPLEVPETMGWLPLPKVPAALKYDADKDVAVGPATSQDWVTIRPGEFVVFFPTDAHAPGSGAGHHRKLIIKVLAD